MFIIYNRSIYVGGLQMIDKILKSKNIIRFFLVLIAIVVIQKIIGVAYISDTLALGMMGFVAGLITLYNKDKK